MKLISPIVLELIDLNRLYEHAACGLLSFAIDGTIIHINQTLLSWLGYQKEEIWDIKFQNMLGQGGKLYFDLFVLPSLQMQAEIKEVSIEIKAPAGSFSALFSAVTSKPNEYAQVIIDATIFKITDRKKYEAELLKEKEQVKEENTIKTLVLEEVAFNQAHLIRAPLANILGLIDLLNENAETNANDRRTIALLKVSAVKLDGVIRDIVGLID